MVGKDKTVKAGKSKHALDKEWEEAVAAAADGDRLTTSAHNSVSSSRPVSSNYIPPKPKGARTVDEDEMPKPKGKGGKKK